MAVMKEASKLDQLELQGSAFVISLDFELFWGVKDHAQLNEYGRNLLGARDAIPRMLALFEEYDIRATWATVGMLFFEDREQLLAALPALRPAYRNARLSNYVGIDGIGRDEQRDPYHFGASLIRRIAGCRGQEIATHTFSHYYCLEDGQTPDTFVADLRAAIDAAARFGIRLKSIVFPRNQFNREYVRLCAQEGIRAYRGNPDHWLYRPAATAREKRSYLKRGLRFLDSYLPIASTHQHTPVMSSEGMIWNIPASRFLRPYSTRLRKIADGQVQRIQGEMQNAARTGSLYHLWWHPHNFGVHTGRNLDTLRRILDTFSVLRARHGMQSFTMAECAEQWANSLVKAESAS